MEDFGIFEFLSIILGELTIDVVSMILSIILMTYLILFIVTSNIFGRKWMSSLPQGNSSSNKKIHELTVEEKKDIKENNMKIYEEWSKEQTFSSTLAGFSLTAVTFILAFENLKEVSDTVGFFVFAFVLEMLSFLFYKYMTSQSHEFYGTLFQFAGLLALLNGLLIFVCYHIEITWMIIIAFIVGYVGFFILTVGQLKSYLDVMRFFK